MVHKIDDQQSYSTGDLARLTGNTLRTVRYYEEVGLLSTAARSEGRHRRFTREDVHRLRTITDLRAVGLSLDEVARVLKVRLRKPEGNEQVKVAASLIDEQLAQLRERIATLTRVEKDLAVARQLLEECHSCEELREQGSCQDCDVLKGADSNVLVSIMLARES
ncbi:MAG: MerR family transcriptional regulator [Myxococcota bacterium]